MHSLKIREWIWHNREHWLVKSDLNSFLESSGNDKKVRRNCFERCQQNIQLCKASELNILNKRYSDGIKKRIGIVWATDKLYINKLFGSACIHVGLYWKVVSHLILELNENPFKCRFLLKRKCVKRNLNIIIIILQAYTHKYVPLLCRVIVNICITVIISYF